MKSMKWFLAALLALPGGLLFLGSAPDAEAGNYRCRPVRVSHCRPVYRAPIVRYHRPVYRTPAVSYRRVCRPAYRPQYYRPPVVHRVTYYRSGCRY